MTEGQDKSMISNIRVLDERAFEEFSGKLSELIKEAATSSQTLDDLVTRTHSLSESATTAKGQLDTYPERVQVPSDLALNDSGRRRPIRINELPASFPIYDIGLDTAVNYRRQMLDAKKIILNGPAGVFEIEDFDVGTQIIFNTIARAEAFSIIGGGETVAAARRLRLGKKIDHLSTGGGACLHFLAGNPMPVIESLKRSKRLYEQGHYS